MFEGAGWAQARRLSRSLTGFVQRSTRSRRAVVPPRAQTRPLLSTDGQDCLLPQELTIAAHVSRLDAALAKLTPDQREAFVLKHVEGRSYEEMAAVLDVSAASLKMRVHRAREALQELLEDYR